MDSYYQDQQGNGMGEGSSSEIVRNSIAWLRKNGYMIDPSEGIPQQEPFPSPDHWSDYSPGDSDETCNPCPAEFPSYHGDHERNSFEAMVLQKLDALQAQMDKMALGNEEIGLRTRGSTQTQLMLMGVNLRSRFEERFKAYAESIVKQFEECLEAYEGRIIKRLEEHSSKTTHMYEKPIHKKFADLQSDIQAVNCWMIRLESRMENEMRQLYCGMFKAQGRFDESDSEDQNDCCPIPLEELPEYIDESNQEDPRNESIEKGCEPTSLLSSAHNENERLLCEDIASLRSSRLANATISEHSMDTEDMREGNFMACSPVENRTQSSGAELSSRPEDSSSSPTSRPCYSCEIAYAPQIQACLGALAASASRETSHEESSWDEKDSAVDFEEQKRRCKKKRKVGAQVWIPRGTLEVMKIFHMTELRLGETSCVPHKAKKRKRRRKSSNPQGGVG